MSRYYKAFDIPVKPLIQWDCYANDDEEYRSLGLNKDHSVMAEENIPQNQYGVCPLKLDGKGGLIARSPAEMDQYRLEYEKEAEVIQFKTKKAIIDVSTFEYERQKCLMDETSRLLYSLLEDSNLDHCEIQTQDGKLMLKAADFPRFVQTYKNALLQILIR